MIRPLVAALHADREARFWFCQLIGWLGWSVGTFLTITLVDGNVDWINVGHIAMSAVLGVLATSPLRPIYQFTFESGLGTRLSVAAISVIIFSGLWTVLRIQVFAWFMGEPPLWKEANYWYFGSLFVFLSWTVLYYGIKYYDMLTTEHQKLVEEVADKRAEQMLRFRAEADAHEAQMRMLHYQLAPHFLFNTLNAINALVRLGEVARAQEMIQLLGDFLRHALKQDAVESVTLDYEMESLMLYLNIEKARFEDRLSLRLDIDPASLNARVPALLLQPIIENAMKYAVSECEDGGELSIVSRVQEEQLYLEVTDTGPGMEMDSAEDSRGIGLRNVKERLEALYGENQKFKLGANDPTGLTVSILIPLIFADDGLAGAQAEEAVFAQA
ncbi:sensor histidine kinase [Halieaceae bacterium IMCC8485]|uniref:Sensor histidine kinase n=1 Tax=Candidatus Seongchinamella marina TaxID=2518990 RepID=A0ABT3SPV5_9GAMM|nr:histidine kinase [Candidatus Seongchinamella marina]MCX2972009.1 sensor histidine kinase [Candidatus Seongchinamella marina]